MRGMSQALNLVDVEVGERLRLTDGRVVTVTDNPRDGLWIFCADESAEETPVLATEVVGREPPAE